MTLHVCYSAWFIIQNSSILSLSNLVLSDVSHGALNSWFLSVLQWLDLTCLFFIHLKTVTIETQCLLFALLHFLYKLVNFLPYWKGKRWTLCAEIQRHGQGRALVCVCVYVLHGICICVCGVECCVCDVMYVLFEKIFGFPVQVPFTRPGVPIPQLLCAVAALSRDLSSAWCCLPWKLQS